MKPKRSPQQIIANLFDKDYGNNVSELSMGSSEFGDSTCTMPSKIVVNLFDMDQNNVSELSMGSTEFPEIEVSHRSCDDTVLLDDGDFEEEKNGSPVRWQPACMKEKRLFSMKKLGGILPPMRPKRIGSTGSKKHHNDIRLNIEPPSKPARQVSIGLPEEQQPSKISFKKLGILPPSRPMRLVSVEEQPKMSIEKKPRRPSRRISHKKVYESSDSSMSKRRESGKELDMTSILKLMDKDDHFQTPTQPMRRISFGRKRTIMSRSA